MLEIIELMIDGIESSSSRCDRIGSVSGLLHNMPITRPVNKERSGRWMMMKEALVDDLHLFGCCVARFSDGVKSLT